MATVQELRARIESIQSRYEREIEAVNQQLTMLERFPEQDPFGDGTVLTFQKRFPGGGIWYSYAVLRADGRWYSTGPKETRRLTWHELVDFWTSGESRDHRVVTESLELNEYILRNT